MLTRVYKKTAFDGWTILTDEDYKLDYAKPALFSDDDKISDWAKDSVYFMAANGIIMGVGGNMFAPKNTAGYENATREQALLIAVRMAEKFTSGKEKSAPNRELKQQEQSLSMDGMRLDRKQKKL